jgi:uncharacterized surface protein with fasciclin (FAS1) repeats
MGARDGPTQLFNHQEDDPMRNKLVPMVLAIVATVFFSRTASAQETLLDTLRNNENVSLFVQAVEASEQEIETTLNSNTPYTVFAPQDDAFSEVADFLDVSLSDLLGNQAVVTQIVRYHIVPERIDASSLADGQTFETLLDGAFIGVDVDIEGVVNINRVADIVEPDLIADNGVIHILDQVLINRIIVQTLQTQPTDAAGEAAETTETLPNLLDTPASVRFVNLTTGLPAIDIYIDGALRVGGLNPGNVTPVIEQPLATYGLTIVTAGDPIEAAILGPIEFETDTNTTSTISIFGTDETLATGTTREIPSVTDSTVVRALFYNALLVDVDLLIGGASYARLSTSQSAIFDFSSDLDVTNELVFRIATSEDLEESPTISLGTEQLNAGNANFVAISGTAAQPEIIVVTEQVSDLVVVEPTLALGGATSTLLAMIESDERLSTLYEILTSGVVDIQDAIGEAESVTIFAPTNQAFANLLASANTSLAQLQAQPELLLDILIYHIVPQALVSDDLASLSGTRLDTLVPSATIGVFQTSFGGLILNRFVEVVEFDIQANGIVIHLIDDVLLPTSALQTLDF